MAEKKVSSKNKNNLNKSENRKNRAHNTDSAYDDFLVRYGQDLRKRSTRTVPEPKKETDKIRGASSVGCGEIDPHLSVNPAAEHHILTKRSGRILADDTGFKAQDYYSRFELKPEMPEIRAEDSIPAENGFEETIIPGQQTMADMVAENGDSQEISVPVESKIASEEEDPFSNAYKALRNDTPFFGKSEKLRAIARTASDDVGMEPESQLSFPAFDPLFRFDEADKKKKSASKKKKEKRADRTPPQKEFDIDEDSIVTSRATPKEATLEEEAETPDIPVNHKGRRFFEVIDNGEFQEEEPAFEINSKQDIRATSSYLKKIGRIALIKTCVLFLSGIVTGIISVVFSNSVKNGTYNTAAFTISNIIFLLLAGIFCIKELAEGAKDILKRKFTLNSGCLLIFVTSLTQSIAVPFSSAFPLDIRILVPAAILSMASMTIPRLLLTNNSRLAVSIIGSSNSVSLFRTLSESGIEGAVSNKYINDDGTSARCNTSVQLPAGIMKKLTNAIPRQFGSDISYIISLIFSFTVGVACGFISESFSGAITAFTAMLMTSLPLSYSVTAAFILFKENNYLAENKSSIISFKSANEATKTKAVVVDACDITEGSACSIHSIKTFGYTDPKKATLCCAAAIKAANSPLLDIISQVVEQGEEEIPDADDFIVCNGGIAALVGNDKVLLGTKEFLSENHVAIPDDDYEEKYITGDRKLLFLSVNGELSMILIVSYHIRRSVAAFFKYLASKDISVLIHSSDPNITPAYIEKKCKLEANSVFALNDTESAYFRDKAMKTESVLNADIFTDGKLSSIFALMKSSFRLSQASALLPTMMFIFIIAGALAVAVPALLSNIYLTGNLYIIIIRIICTAVTAAVPILLSEK